MKSETKQMRSPALLRRDLTRDYDYITLGSLDEDEHLVCI